MSKQITTHTPETALEFVESLAREVRRRGIEGNLNAIAIAERLASLIRCRVCHDMCEPTIVVGICDPCVRQHGADIVANESGD